MPATSALDQREQRYALLAAGLGAVTSVILWAPAFEERAALALAGIGLAMSALLALAARRRSRLLTGVAAVLLSFGPWGMAWVLGLPYLVLAGWLALRAPRPQPGERAGRRGATTDGEEADTDRLRVPVTGPPRANKRYTPPRRRS